MGNDEQKAFKYLDKNKAIQRPIIELYHGRWIKELGDGVMGPLCKAQFASLWQKSFSPQDRRGIKKHDSFISYTITNDSDFR